MKFHKMLKELIKNPELEFNSESLCMELQDLGTIRYWMTQDSAGDQKQRSANFDKIVTATDWELDDGQEK